MKTLARISACLLLAPTFAAQAAAPAGNGALMPAQAKAFGDANRDLVYTPLAPCRLVDTRGGAPFAGGPYSPEERRTYQPGGACSIPTSGVSALMVSFTTFNMTPGSGGYLALLAPGALVTGIVDVFNLGASWSASNTIVSSGTAGQFDAYVNTASAHLSIDVLGYFGPPSTGAVGTAQLADGSVTAGKLASNGCLSGQVLRFNGVFWACSGAPGCAAGDLQPCYTGPISTMGVGVCKSGLRRCDPQTGAYGLCEGQVLPSIEQPDGLDNNCNGVVDEPPSAPIVLSTTPTGGTPDASVAAPVTVAFSQPMDPTSLTNSTFTVNGPGGAVAGNVSYAGSIATFMPIARLSAGATYTATVTTGAREQTGIPLASSYAFSFATSEDQPVPHVHGCPTAEPNARLRPLDFGPVKVLKMDSTVVTAFRVIASPSGRASVMLTQGQTTVSPGGVKTDLTVSRCPGVIETNLHPACRYTSFSINYNAITAFNRLPPGFTGQNDLAVYGCYAPDTEPYYVNVRWTYPSCPFGSGQCGFAMQWAEGPF